VSPHAATLIFALGTVGLFLLDRDRDARTSPALWLPIVWLALGGSRNVSQWLGAPLLPSSSNDYLEGSPLDRLILTGLIVIGVIVLFAREERSRDLLRHNAPLVLFFLYCAASVLWSDYPLVALKRWTKALGNIVMVLVVLTDPDVMAALKKFLTSTAFLLIPSSILLIKYYPEMGRFYDKWEGTAYYLGASSDKNMLGAICMIVGLGVLWRLFDMLDEPAARGRRVLALGTTLGMTFWLFHLANSATSLACFVLGATLLAILSLRRPPPRVVHLLVGGMAIVASVVYMFPDAFTFLVGSMGRNTTLTGRTELWNDLLRMDTNPLFGTGFESFFLGDRLELLWSKYWWHPNEAHNGYLETYLTLGAAGLCLLASLVLTGYRNALNIYRSDPQSGSLRIALLIVAVVYNTTEAAIKVMNPVWILFLLAVTAVPELQHLEESASARQDEPEESATLDRGYRDLLPVADAAPKATPGLRTTCSETD
jgi:O-antigen ligase